MRFDKQRIGYLEGILSAVLNTVLFGFKLWVGLAAGSVAMIADAWHTMSDTLTSLVVILGFRVSSKPRDSLHPFGHGRAELVASVIIGTMLALVGVSFLKDSYFQLRARRSVAFGGAALIVFSISVVLKEALAQFSIRAGKRFGSQSLIADGWHHRSDALASALILLGALFGKLYWWIDGALGLAVSLLILYASFEIVKQAANALMGEPPDENITRRIHALIQERAPEASDVHHIHLHRYGDHIEVTLHIRMPEEMRLKAAHDVSTYLEDSMRAVLGMDATIHMEPRGQ